MDIEDQIFLAVAYAETRGAKVVVFCRDWTYVLPILHEAVRNLSGVLRVQGRTYEARSGGFVKIIAGADVKDNIERVCGLQLTHVFIDEAVHCSERDERMIAARIRNHEYPWGMALYAHGEKYVV